MSLVKPLIQFKLSYTSLLKEGAFRLRTLFALRTVHTRLTALTVIALAAVCTLASRPAQAQNDSGSYGPVVAIVTPEYADILKGLESIVVSISPRRYPAQTIELLVDGKSITGAIPAQTRFKWDTKLFIDGPHTLSVRVTDTQGFIGQAETMVYINNSNLRTESGAPVLTWGGVQNGENLSGIAKVRLSTGSDFGIKYVFLNVNSAIAPDVKPPLASWMTNRPPYEFSLDTTRFKDGMYVLDAYAWDAMENERLAPRLTVGFFNHGLNATTLQETAPATSNTNTADTQTAPAKTTRTAAAPPVSLPPSSAELLRTPGTYTVTGSSGNNWNETAPAGTSADTSGATYRTSTTVSARISEPPRIARTEQAPVNDTVPVSRRVESNIQPSATVADTHTVSVETQVTGSTATSTPEITTHNPVASARISEPARLARDLPAVSAGRTPPAVVRNNPTSQPRLTMAGKPGDAPIAGSSASNAGALASSTNAIAKISEPTRFARALPETHTAEPAALPTPKTVPSSIKTAPTGNATANFVPLQTPDSVVAGNSNLAPATVRSNANASRLTQPRMAALPPASLPVAPGTTIPSRTNMLLSMVESNSVNTRLATTSLNGPERISAISALPTAPRLAFSPNLNQPRTPVDTALGAAIVVSPLSAQSALHVSQRDETLVAIAARYKVPLATLANLNDLPLNARIKQGDTVTLPQAIQISYNGQAVTGDVAPFLIGSTSIAPFRYMFEKQGGKLEWDAVNRRVTARNGSHEVTINIGSNMALVNQEEVMMDMAAFLLSGRTMVPVRFFEKAMQAKVEWEPTTGRIYVAMTP